MARFNTATRPCLGYGLRHAAGSPNLTIWGGWSAVNISTMTDGNDEDHEPMVLQVTDDPVIADTVAPEVAELGALQRPAKLAGIVERRHAIA